MIFRTGNHGFSWLFHIYSFFSGTQSGQVSTAPPSCLWTVFSWAAAAAGPGPPSIDEARAFLPIDASMNGCFPSKTKRRHVAWKRYEKMKDVLLETGKNNGKWYEEINEEINDINEKIWMNGELENLGWCGDRYHWGTIMRAQSFPWMLYTVYGHAHRYIYIYIYSIYT